MLATEHQEILISASKLSNESVIFSMSFFLDSNHHCKGFFDLHFATIKEMQRIKSRSIPSPRWCISFNAMATYVKIEYQVKGLSKKENSHCPHGFT